MHEKILAALFLPFLAITCVIAYYFPIYFLWIKPHISIFLSIIIFLVGLNIKPEDFISNFKTPGILLLTYILKYGVMPFVAIGLGKLFQLPPHFLMGFLIISAMPGAVASTLWTRIYQANVSLVITLTAITSLLSPIVAPVLIYHFFHKTVAIAYAPIIQTLCWIVLVPICLAFFAKKMFKEKTRVIEIAGPWIALIFLMFIIGLIVSLNTKEMTHIPFKLTSVLILYSLIAVIIGFIFSWVFHFSRKNSIPMILELSMADAGVATVIILKFFNKAAALVPLLYTIWESIFPVFLIFFSKDRAQRLRKP